MRVVSRLREGTARVWRCAGAPFRRQTRLQRVAVAAVGVAVAVFIADALFPPPVARASAVSAIIADRNGYWLHAFATKDGRWRFSADLDAIDPAFVNELIAIEDQRFWSHWGVDPIAVARAGATALRSGRIVSGASTITMQTARLLEPRERTFGAKLIEMIRALQIEARLSKREILEIYLTLAPYGGNLEGVRAASLIYYGREPERLSPAERAMLIALPQAPEARRPDRRAAAATAARAMVLDRLAAAGVLDAGVAREAKDSPVVGSRRVFPRIAYHAAAALAAAREGPQSMVVTTLDVVRQRAAERLVADHVKNISDGATAAVIVVDDKTGEVLASVGSSGLDVGGGWIDLTNVVRSPGSLLKPFIYALAFEDGIAGANTVIDDMPRGFGGYRPENFDHLFRGEVRVRDALQHSLNVPAVATLEKVGVERFSAALQSVGATILRKKSAEDRPSLALALGGAGVTMRDVATLYSGLANDGRVRPLVWTPGGAAHPGIQLFAAEPALRVNAILRGSPSLAGRAPAALSNDAPIIAYKTGTSYGYRDAWAAGHASGYTIVVWVGRADGAPRPGATGRTAAAPLLFGLFDAMTNGRSVRPIDTPEEEPGAPALVRLSAPAEVAPPVILFPAPGAEIFPGAFGGDGVVLAASGGHGAYRWYVDGAEIAPDLAAGRAIWRPSAPGFYDIAVVDAGGVASAAKVRVATLQ